MEQTELWKDVVGYEGRYQVSNRGRVKSLIRKGLIMSPSKKKNGNEYVVNLSNGVKCRVFMVHRLVLEAFVGPRPEKHIAIAKDGNIGNTVLNNLMWKLESEVRATNARLRHGKGRASFAVLTDCQVCEIKRRLSGPVPRGLISEIAREYAVHYEVIRRINAGETYCWLNAAQEDKSPVSIADPVPA